MLEYYRIDVSEGINFNKTDGSREHIICHYLYFLEINLKFQPEVCNGCHYLVQKAISVNDVVIVSVKGNGNRIHFKDEAINYLKKNDLTEISGTL